MGNLVRCTLFTNKAGSRSVSDSSAADRVHYSPPTYPSLFHQLLMLDETPAFAVSAAPPYRYDSVRVAAAYRLPPARSCRAFLVKLVATILIVSTCSAVLLPYVIIPKYKFSFVSDELVDVNEEKYNDAR